MDKRATTWAHLPRGVAFDRGITHGAARLLACLHTLAIEQNPQAPVTDPMSPDELRALLRLFGRTQFYKHMKNLQCYALIEIEKMPGPIWRVRPQRVFQKLSPENRTQKASESGKPYYEDYIDSIKDSKDSLKVLKNIRPSPENRTQFRDMADPEVLEALRSVGVGGKMRSLIALAPHTTLEYIKAYVTAIESGALPLRLAIAKMRDGDLLEICAECHWLDGQHNLDCTVAIQKYLKGWFND